MTLEKWFMNDKCIFNMEDLMYGMPLTTDLTCVGQENGVQMINPVLIWRV